MPVSSRARVSFPTPPTGLAVTTPTGPNGGVTTLSLTWVNAHPSYQIEVYRDGALIATRPAGTTTYSATGLTANTSYTFTLRHLLSGGVRSFATAGVSGTTLDNLRVTVNSTTYDLTAGQV